MQLLCIIENRAFKLNLTVHIAAAYARGGTLTLLPKRAVHAITLITRTALFSTIMKIDYKTSELHLSRLLFEQYSNKEDNS